MATAITGAQIVRDLEELAVAGKVDDVQLVREGLYAIADEVRALDPDSPEQSDGHVELEAVLALVEPAVTS